jgi:hypothetical protein
MHSSTKYLKIFNWVKFENKTISWSNFNVSTVELFSAEWAEMIIKG